MSFREAVIYHGQQAAEWDLDPRPWGLLVLSQSFTLNDSDDIKKSRVTKLGLNRGIGELGNGLITISKGQWQEYLLFTGGSYSSTRF